LALPSLALPSLAVAGLTGFILWVAVTALLRQGRLESVLSAGRAELAAPLLVALVVATGICERIWPAERRRLLARGHVQDACYLALHAIVVIPLMTLLSVGGATLVADHAHWIELRSTARWPGWLLIPLTIVAMDGANWLAHYADHRLGALWRFHALHHSQEELSVLTSFRAHPLMHTTGFLLATIPVMALMPTRPIAPVLITVYVCIGTLQHANLRWTFGPVGRVLVSPAYHRLHHAPDTQHANLGVVLTIWDVLAGRARPPAARSRSPAPAWTAAPSPSSNPPQANHPTRPCACSPPNSPSPSTPTTTAKPPNPTGTPHLHLHLHLHLPPHPHPHPHPIISTARTPRHMIISTLPVLLGYKRYISNSFLVAAREKWSGRP
jgi:sterol desaturase/sphingolipid hydroxylase (fatty acid hydroxylase superfamily)